MARVSEEFERALQQAAESQKQEAEDSLQRRIDYSTQMAQVLETSNKDMEDFSQRLDSLFEHLSAVAASPLPRTPSYAEATRPKNWIEAFSRYIAPAIVGITAVVYPGKWKQNYVFFNSMMSAIKEGDEEKWRRAVTEWKLNFEHEKQSRQDRLNSLKLQMERLMTSQRLKDARAQAQIKRLEQMINAENKALELASSTHSKMIDNAYKLMQLKLREQELGLKAEDIAARHALKKTKEEDLEKAQKKEWDRFMSTVDAYVRSQAQSLFGITPEGVAKGIRYAMARHQVNVPPEAIAKIIYDYTGAKQEDVVTAIQKVFGDILLKQQAGPSEQSTKTGKESEPTAEQQEEPVFRREPGEDLADTLIRFLREARGRFSAE